MTVFLVVAQGGNNVRTIHFNGAGDIACVKTHKQMDTKVKNQAEVAFGQGEFQTQNVSLIPFEQLEPGWHKVKVRRAIFTDDTKTGLVNPTPKPMDKRAPWDDPTYQLAVYFANDENKGATRRFTRYGYATMEDLLKEDPKTAKECVAMGDQRYAVDKKDKVRIVSKEKTRRAELIVNRLMTASGVPEGTTGKAILDELIGKELQIEVTCHVYNGKTYFDVTNFAKADTPAEELKRIPKPQGVLDYIPATESEA